MRKYILMVLCIFCTTYISAQEKEVRKDLVIHKKDGSKFIVPIEVKHTVEFWGQNEVKDNDYVQVGDVSGPLENHSVNMTLNDKMTYDHKKSKERYSDYGIVWSTEPGVTIENGEKAIQIDEYSCNFKIGNNQLPSYDETTYYYRAYVTIYDKTYYSEEKSHTFYPHIVNVSVPQNWNYAESAYVYPTEDAFKAAFLKAVGTECSDVSFTILEACWRKYITVDKAKELLASADGEIKKFYEGDVFFINEISEDFINTIFTEGTFHLSTESINYDESYTNFGIIDTVECDESWQITGNAYWRTTPTNVATRPKVGINLPLVLPSFTYNITIIFAPDTEAEADSLATASKVRFTYYKSTAKGNLSSKDGNITNPETGSRDFIIDNALKCDTATIAIEATDLQENLIQIQSSVTRSELDKGYSNEIRIADIIVERKKIVATEE